MQFGRHSGTKTQRFELLADCFDQPDGCQRLRTKVDEERFHLRQRRLREIAHILNMLRCAVGIMRAQTLRCCSSCRLLLTHMPCSRLDVLLQATTIRIFLLCAL